MSSRQCHTLLPSTAWAPHCVPSPDCKPVQDKPWREQQRRLLSAQCGPKEVERLAVNEMVPLPGEEDSTTGKLLEGLRFKTYRVLSASWVWAARSVSRCWLQPAGPGAEDC